MIALISDSARETLGILLLFAELTAALVFIVAFTWAMKWCLVSLWKWAERRRG